MVLVGRHGDEGRLREDVAAEGCVLGAEAVVLVRLDDVETRLVFVHGVEYYLRRGEIKGVRMMELSGLETV